jgi:hypothetical protein
MGHSTSLPPTVATWGIPVIYLDKFKPELINNYDGSNKREEFI